MESLFIIDDGDKPIPVKLGVKDMNKSAIKAKVADQIRKDVEEKAEPRGLFDFSFGFGDKIKKSFTKMNDDTDAEIKSFRQQLAGRRHKAKKPEHATQHKRPANPRQEPLQVFKPANADRPPVSATEIDNSQSDIGMPNPDADAGPPDYAPDVPARAKHKGALVNDKDYRDVAESIAQSTDDVSRPKDIAEPVQELMDGVIDDSLLATDDIEENMERHARNNAEARAKAKSQARSHSRAKAKTQTKDEIELEFQQTKEAEDMVLKYLKKHK